MPNVLKTDSAAEAERAERHLMAAGLSARVRMVSWPPREEGLYAVWVPWEQGEVAVELLFRLYPKRRKRR